MSSQRHVRPLSLPLVFKCLSIGANAVCAGGVFTLPLLSPRLVSHLKFNQLQLTTIVLTGMVSQYPLASIAGRIVDCYGPQTCSLTAAIFYSLSFGGISIEISRWPDELSYPPSSSFYLLVFYSLMAGFATVFSYYSSLFASSKTFPDYIGISSGASMALFGLSPLFLTTIATKCFPDHLAILDPVRYMSFLAALTGTVHLAGALALKGPGQKTTANNLESNPVLVDENTPLLHHLPDGPLLRAATISNPIFPLKDPSFWMLAFFCLFTLGPAEMVISNIATIFLALPSQRSFSPSSTDSAARQVQLLSISNTAVRVITGLIADFVSPAASLVNGDAIFYRKHFISRVFFMALPSLLLTLTFLWTSAFARTQTGVWVLCLGVGVSYGTIFTILPSIVSAIWGMDDLGRNFGILMNAPFAGTTMFSYLYAIVSQAHAKADGICIGSSCWQFTFWISAGTSLISLGLSVILWQKWKGPATNPEFSVVEYPGYHEYRIENWRLARDGSGKVINGVSSLSWLDALLALALSYLWLKTTRIFLIPVLSAVLYHAWRKCSQVLSESIVVLPSLGVQLETRRGFPFFPKPLFTSRRFIPLHTLQDVIINEGLHRWDIRYYLAFVKEKCPDNVCLEVAYENILPYHDVLLHIYQGLRTQIPSPMTIRVRHAT